MKIEFEIEDALVQQLVYAAYQAPADEPREVTAARGALNIVRQYANCPEIVELKHLNALAIVRAKAVEAAARSTTEASRDSAARTADELCDYMLRGR
jgi:hypothetical protein